jgi:citrate lyase beta subunit
MRVLLHHKIISTHIYHGNQFEIIPFLYMPATQKRFLDNALRLLEQKNSLHVIIDLEDSLKNTDLISEIKNKDLGRKTMSEYAYSFSKYLHRVWVRINGVNTPYFVDDLQTMFSLKCLIHGLVLPKAEDPEVIQDLLKYFDVIPLIETQKGFANRESLMASGIRFVRFGPQDYFFEKQVFPLPQSPYSSALFDSVIDDFLITAQQHDTVFVCPIFTNLKLEEDFLISHRYIFQKFCKTRIGVTALTPTQLTWVERLQTEDWTEIAAHYRTWTFKELATYAQQSVSGHKKRKNPNLSVSHSHDSGEYNTPYSVFSANSYLNQIQENREGF